MLLLGSTDLCISTAGQWDLCTQHLIHGLEVSTKLANEHFWRIRIITKLSGMKDHKGRGHSHCILIYVNMAPCGMANPLTLCPLFNFQLISLAGALFSSLPSVRKSADLSFQRGLGIKQLIRVYTVYPHLTTQMSGLPYWFSICTVQYSVFLIMTFIFWMIFSHSSKKLSTPGWTKFQFLPRMMKNTKSPNFYSPHRHGSIAERLAVIVFKHSGL